MTENALIRVRFPRDIVGRLDAMTEHVSDRLRRNVSRAAVVRALVALALRTSPHAADIAVMLDDDAVKRGRAMGYSPKKKGASHG